MNDVTSFRAFFQVRNGSTSDPITRRSTPPRNKDNDHDTGNRTGTSSGQVAIVTGASSGIGRATAKLFAAEGAKVVVGARREAELAGLGAGIKGSGGSAVSLAGDVRSGDYAKALGGLAGKTYGRLGVAFNNPGTLRRARPSPAGSPGG